MADSLGYGCLNINIRKVKNGFVVDCRCESYVFLTFKSMIKFLDKAMKEQK